MKKYIFSNIKLKFDWQIVYTVVGIIICIISYFACRERARYDNIFNKDVLVEYKVLSKNDKYEHTGEAVLQNTKTEEIVYREFSNNDHLIYKTIKIGEIVKLKTRLDESLSQQEKEKLWKGSEPYGCTWIFILVYGVISLIIAIPASIDYCYDTFVEKFGISTIMGFIFVTVGAIFGIFI